MTDHPFPPPNQFRDRELADRFAGQAVPAHRNDFWSELSTGLAAAVNGTESASETDLGPAAHVVDLAVDGDESQRSWRPVVLAAAAAVVVLAAIGLALGLGRPLLTDAADEQGSVRADRGPESPGTSEPPERGAQEETAEAVEVPASPFPPVDYGTIHDVTPIGSGVGVGTSPDGSAVLVIDEVEDLTDLGCEGATRLTLYGHDVLTGARRPLLPDGIAAESGGLDLLFADPARPLAGRARTVFWTDFCDGVRNSVWTATMAPDGTISQAAELTVGSADDPFADQVTAAIARGEVSADRRYRVGNEDDTVVVRSVDPAGDDEWRYPGLTNGWPPAFAPAGDVVVFAEGVDTVFWRYRTGEVWRVESNNNGGYAFGADGAYLFLNGLEFLRTVDVLVLGDVPDPAPATRPPATPPTCSGVGDLGPVPVDGLPPRVAERVVAIDELAARCDFVALAELAGLDFIVSFGGGEPSAFWADLEASGGSPMEQLRLVLRQPYAAGDLDTLADVWIWPAVFVDDDCINYAEEDLASLRALGYDDQQIADECEFGGYLGYRTAITENGDWVYFVAGD